MTSPVKQRVSTSVDLLIAAFMVLLCGANSLADQIASSIPEEDLHRYQRSPRPRLKRIENNRWYRPQLARELGLTEQYVTDCAMGRVDDPRVRSLLHALDLAARVRGNGHREQEVIDTEIEIILGCYRDAEASL